ncbi:hypothetical protein MKX01_027360 [Papaver californicum]|nr:hypothetical protein MKX01_027360 [Papaver californicum]
MEEDRLNSPHTSAISLEIFGHQLQFSQDPNSKHLGTTVWDASMVFVKFLERNCRKGRFCPAKLKGKRVIELGAGCGVAGFGMAMLGCDVVTTDQIEVLPLLMRNVDRNTSRILQSHLDSSLFAVEPPFDFIIGTDVVYAEHLLDPLLQTIFSLSGPKTTILLGYEIRNMVVHEQMLQMWKSNFEMDSKYQHPSIHLYIMGSKAQPLIVEKEARHHDKEVPEVGSTEKDENDEDSESCSRIDELEDCSSKEVLEDRKLVARPEDGKLDDWEARRCGAMAARLLRDIKIT